MEKSGKYLKREKGKIVPTGWSPLMKMKNKKLLLEVPIDNMAVVSIVKAFGARKEDIDLTHLPWVYLNMGPNDHTVRNALADLGLLDRVQSNI